MHTNAAFDLASSYVELRPQPPVSPLARKNNSTVGPIPGDSEHTSPHRCTKHNKLKQARTDGACTLTPTHRLTLSLPRSLSLSVIWLHPCCRPVPAPVLPITLCRCRQLLTPSARVTGRRPARSARAAAAAAPDQPARGGRTAGRDAAEGRAAVASLLQAGWGGRPD